MEISLNFTNYKPGFLICTIGILWLLCYWALSFLWQHGVFQGIAPTLLVASFLGFYDKLLWKFPVFSLLVKVPDLNGEYEGTVEYHWDDKNQNKTCNLQIRQTASFIKVKCSFQKEGENETSSESKKAFFDTDEVGGCSLYFYYQNRGSCKDGDTLDQHDGMTILQVIEEGKDIKLEGSYFTNRNPQTKGRIKVSKIILPEVNK